jgi:transposase-like protein
MSKIKRLSYEEKVYACELYEHGFGSYKSIADDFGISRSGFYNIYTKYKNFGSEALKMQTKHRAYTKEFKNKVIAAYKNGEGSYPELAVKYNIHNFSVIARWVLGYNDSNKTTYSGRGGVTMKGRKTTLDERIEIIGYLIDNDINYHKTSSHFKVSYQQVYNWYKKYHECGVDGLVDRRGRKKGNHELSEIELLKRENERLKRELELSNATKIVLKKKREFEEEARLRELEMKDRIKR